MSHSTDEPRNVFLFMCFFCNNQYRLLVDGKAGSDDLERVFESRLRGIGRVVALLDSWRDSQYLTRIWTIFEQYSAAKLNIPVQMVLPPAAAKSLLDEFESGKEGILRVKRSFSEVHSENAVASLVEDEIKVKGLIRQSIGFDSVDSKVRERLQEWVGKEVRAYMDALVDADNEEALVRHCATHEGTMIFTIPDEHTVWGRTRSKLTGIVTTMECPPERVPAPEQLQVESDAQCSLTL